MPLQLLLDVTGEREEEEGEGPNWADEEGGRNVGLVPHGLLQLLLLLILVVVVK